MKVLIIGYACHPESGGETAHAWNWAWHLSRFHEVSVLADPSDRPLVEASLAACPSTRLKFHWLAVPQWRDLWDHRKANVGLAVHYLQWLRLAYAKAVKLHEQMGFDVVHHVSYGTVNAPPPFWKLPVPFVWGPIGGAQRAPAAFRRYLRPFSGPEIFRNTRVSLLALSCSLRRAARSSAMILVTNPETYSLITRAGGRDVRLFLDSGIPSSYISTPPTLGPKDKPFTLLWLGRMERRKALPLALEALAETKDLHARLLIVGDGEMLDKWASYAKHLNLADRVHFLGRIPWKEVPALYQSADAFLFTSLRDSFGTQVLEAMAHGLPILTLDHQGVGTFVPKDAGIKVPVMSPRQTVAGLADGIRRLAGCPEERQKMGEAAHAFAKTQTWERRAACMSELYEELSARPAREDASGRSPTRHLAPAATCPGRAAFAILGVRIYAVQIQDTIEQMERWIGERDRTHSIAATSMHGIVEAHRDLTFKEILNSTDLVVPDGMPLVWLGRRQGHHLAHRVYGPELFLAFCEQTIGKGYRHFFYGGEPGVAEQLARSLQHRFPGLQVIGTFPPPFRPLNKKEDEEIVALISRASPDVLWVGLGTPKQERWMQEHKDKLSVPVQVGVGAAFDILSGRRRQAPRWMGDHGLECLFRLCQEPRRLWRRYLIYGTQFIAYLVSESLGLKKLPLARKAGDS